MNFIQQGLAFIFVFPSKTIHPTNKKARTPPAPHHAEPWPPLLGRPPHSSTRWWAKYSPPSTNNGATDTVWPKSGSAPSDPRASEKLPRSALSFPLTSSTKAEVLSGALDYMKCKTLERARRARPLKGNGGRGGRNHTFTGTQLTALSPTRETSEDAANVVNAG